MMIIHEILFQPWDLKANSDRLEGHWIGRNIYSKAMGGNLHAMFKAHGEPINLCC